jgi:hypothetical protein
MEKPIFQTKITTVEYSLIILILLAIILGLIYCSLFMSLSILETLIIFGGFFTLIYRVIRIKVFILFADRLVVKRPFLLTDKFDNTIQLKDIRKITFLFSGLRYGGGYRMNIAFFSRLNRENINYKFDNGLIHLKELIGNLRIAGINIKDDI